MPGSWANVLYVLGMNTVVLNSMGLSKVEKELQDFGVDHYIYEKGRDRVKEARN